MVLDSSIPKARDKVAVIKTLKVKGNRHGKCLSSVMPAELEKGKKGQIYKVVSNKHVFVSMLWDDKTKFDLDLRVDTAVWGIHFKKK